MYTKYLPVITPHATFVYVYHMPVRCRNESKVELIVAQEMSSDGLGPRRVKSSLVIST